MVATGGAAKRGNEMSSELFNFSTAAINGKTYVTAQRWREGFTVPETVIVREVSEDEVEGMAS